MNLYCKVPLHLIYLLPAEQELFSPQKPAEALLSLLQYKMRFYVKHISGLLCLLCLRDEVKTSVLEEEEVLDMASVDHRTDQEDCGCCLQCPAE